MANQWNKSDYKFSVSKVSLEGNPGRKRSHEYFGLQLYHVVYSNYRAIDLVQMVPSRSMFLCDRLTLFTLFIGHAIFNSSSDSLPRI